MSDPVVLLSTGDVVGPAGGVTDNSMVLFSGTSGKLIKGNNAVVTAAGLALLDDVDAAAQRVTLGLGNVDNTSDVNKPISTATQTALNLKATIDSPTFTGDPKAPTPAQFDNTTKAATTAFVQRGLGNMQSTLYAASTTLTAADAGKTVLLATTGTVMTLPLLSSVAIGSVFRFVNVTSNGGGSVIRQGSDLIYFGSTTLSSVAVNGGETLDVVAHSTGWVATGGSMSLAYASSSFGASLAANGYQRLPSGLIIQWGSSTGSTAMDVAVTFPITFPSELYFVSGQIIQNVNNLHAVFTTESETTAGFAFNAVTSGGRNAYPVKWFAIGR